MSDLAAALAALQADLPRIKRTATGQAGTRRYKYAAYDRILAAVRPVLAKHGFTWHTLPGWWSIPGDDQTRFCLRYELTHIETGHMESGYYPLTEGPAQSMGGQISYAKRYALVAVLDLEVEGEDNDAMMDAPTRRPVRGPRTGPDHERLRQGTHEPEPGQRPAERGPLPPGEDVWRDQPAGLMPQDDPEDRPGSITRDQQKAMHAAFTQAGITDRNERMAWTRATLDLPDLDSSGDLSYQQAAALLAALHEQSAVRERR